MFEKEHLANYKLFIEKEFKQRFKKFKLISKQK